MGTPIYQAGNGKGTKIDFKGESQKKRQKNGTPKGT